MSNYASGKREAHLAHCRSRRDTASDGLEQAIDVLCTGPLLVRENIAADLSLFALDEADIGSHAILGEGFRELIRNESIAVQTSELQ